MKGDQDRFLILPPQGAIWLIIWIAVVIAALFGLKEFGII
jgi:hypothetical protein